MKKKLADELFSKQDFRLWLKRTKSSSQFSLLFFLADGIIYRFGKENIE